MPLQNRVTPEGDIVAVAQRGTMLGNRGGCFHGLDQNLKLRRFATRQWICCLLQFKNRRRHPLMQPGLYTELFFLDEATAWAAGHRPCFECRRADAVRFAELWNAVEQRTGRAAAPDMDVRLHAERIDRYGRKVTSSGRFGDLPDGVMVRYKNQPGLVHRAQFLAWSFDGYRPAIALAGDIVVEVLTPPTMVAIIRAGCQPMLHSTAA